MLKLAACLVLIAGCVTELSTTEDGLHGDSDGWGAWCNNTPNTNGLYNKCHSGSGVEGVCDVGVCRRYCANSLGGCPKHFHPVYIVGDACECEPNLRGWDSGQMAPAVSECHSDYSGGFEPGCEQ